jgi:hypothetical protein
MVELNQVDVLQRWHDERPEVFTQLDISADIDVYAGAIVTPEVFAWWFDHYPKFLEQNYQVIFDTYFYGKAFRSERCSWIRGEWGRFPLRQWVEAWPRLVENYFAERRCHFVQSAIASENSWMIEWFADNYPHFDAILARREGELLNPTWIAQTIANQGGHVSLKALKWVRRWCPKALDENIVARTISAATPTSHLQWVKERFPKAIILCAEDILPRYVSMTTWHDRVMWWMQWAMDGKEREDAIIAEIGKTLSVEMWRTTLMKPPPEPQHTRCSLGGSIWQTTLIGSPPELQRARCLYEVCLDVLGQAITTVCA